LKGFGINSLVENSDIPFKRLVLLNRVPAFHWFVMQRWIALGIFEMDTHLCRTQP